MLRSATEPVPGRESRTACRRALCRRARTGASPSFPSSSSRRRTTRRARRRRASPPARTPRFEGTGRPRWSPARRASRRACLELWTHRGGATPHRCRRRTRAASFARCEFEARVRAGSKRRAPNRRSRERDAPRFRDAAGPRAVARSRARRAAASNTGRRPCGLRDRSASARARADALRDERRRSPTEKVRHRVSRRCTFSLHDVGLGQCDGRPGGRDDDTTRRGRRPRDA